MSSLIAVVKGTQKSSIAQWVVQNRVIVLFIAMASLSTLFVPYFSSRLNISALLTQTAILALVAVGISFPVIGGGIDLSIGSTLFLAGVFYALFQDFGLPIAIIAGIMAGVLAGVINGLLVTVARVNFFIATLATSIGFRGIGLTLTHNNSLPGHIPGFGWLGNTHVTLAGFPIEIPVFASILLIIIMYIIMSQTQLGRNIYAIGGNRAAAMLAGININLTFFSTFVLSGMMGGIAGVLLTSRLVTASTLVGVDDTLIGVSAAVLGGVSIFGGTGSLFGAVLGLTILQIIGNCLNLLAVDAYFQLIIRGFIVIAVIVFDAYYNPKKGQAWG